MVRIYTQQSCVTLLRLNAPYGSVLISQLQTAATSQQERLASSGSSFPELLWRPLVRLNTTALALAAALQLEPSHTVFPHSA